ncbi:hypothetical protein, partial [Streptomyces fungicidicus]|uniref:hypothetical protein n=1 Tax=Streptomyces fungicidicus TaxID=68203 RepID=UPI003D76565D
MTSGAISLYMHKSFILNRIILLNVHYPSPHKFKTVGLQSGLWDSKSTDELLLELKKFNALFKSTAKEYNLSFKELDLLNRAISLDSKLTDKSKNGEMNKIMHHYATYFDEESGNNRDTGIKEVHEYLTGELNSHLNKHKNIKIKIENIKKEIDKRNTPEEYKKGVESSQNSLPLLTIIPINSFTIIRI